MSTTAGHDYANWDLTSYFPELDGEAYRTFLTGLESDLAALLVRTADLRPLTEDNAADLADLVVAIEAVAAKAGHISSYLLCLAADDARDEVVQRHYAHIGKLRSQHGKLISRLQASLKACDDRAFTTLVEDKRLDDAKFPLMRLRQAAQFTMDVELEELAGDLAVDGFHSWGRMYDTMAGKLEFDLEKPDGTVERVPFALKRSLVENEDPAIRRAALVGSNKAWKEIEHIAAAALNAIGGQRLALYERRGIEHFLDQALFESNITRRTLDAMLGAIADNYELPRSYLRRKASLLGMETLGFQDISAPLPLSGGAISWQGARDRIVSAFKRSYPALGDFAEMALNKNWIESEPRAGKAPGGFCTSSRHIRESRIFMTYNNTLGDVQTLAHELGHAYHNWVMRDLRPMACSYSMTLAETASTYAETTLTDAILADEDTTETDKAFVLDTRLEASQAFLLNIPMRFLFEKRFYEERANGEVSVSRLKELMLDAQRETYGDVLDQDQLDPWFWASKAHFFITHVTFYNFPYSFGYLFSLSVYKRGRELGEEFASQYEELLRLTGSDTAENVARRSLGVDIESKDFWLDAIELVRADLEAFEALTDKMFH